MPRSRKNEKGVLEVGFFIELKTGTLSNFSLRPPSCWHSPDTVPLPTKPKGIRKEAEDRKF